MSHLDRASDGAFLLRSLTRRDIAFKVSYLNGPRETLERSVRLLTNAWSPNGIPFSNADHWRTWKRL